ncbi:unnamed protein product [Dibothriocephalus latus]|uniref:Uncharacterized protein n=1 Tax=Dibothriocephalus latus TaxID=60516 RepID=A0A3P6UQI8_DIBLA|nr:unnamed protein product [Dibothriocephalus latus]
MDGDNYIAVNETCYLDSYVYFAFPCPVVCSTQDCVLNINLPEISFLGQLTVQTNETHFAMYDHLLEEVEEGRESVIKFNVTQGEKPIIFFTCIYLDEHPFEHATYRYIWPGVDAFLGKDKQVHSSSDIAQLQWTVRSWGPREYRKLECTVDDKLLCAGITTSQESGKCQKSYLFSHTYLDVQEEGDQFIFTYAFERAMNAEQAIIICNSSNDVQTQTVYWQEYRIPFDAMALGNTLKDFLSQARVFVRGYKRVIRIAPSSTFTVTCSIARSNMSWSCVVPFDFALLQRITSQGKKINTMDHTLDGKTYQISGELDVCEDNASVIGKLKTTRVRLLETTTSFHRQDYVLMAALQRILDDGPKTICG